MVGVIFPIVFPITSYYSILLNCIIVNYFILFCCDYYLALFLFLSFCFVFSISLTFTLQILFDLMLHLLLYLIFVLLYLLSIYIIMYPAQSLEPEMWEIWGKGQQFHSSFALDIWKHVLLFFLTGHILTFTK